MKKLLNELTQIARYSKEGKMQFTEFIKSWSQKNLDNFAMKVEKNRFVLDLRELLSVFLLLANLTIILLIVRDFPIGEWLTSLLLLIMTFRIQLRLIFLVLSFLLPSSNIVLTKRGNNLGKSEIIICAHYDTKNSMITRPKGRIRGFLKYNIYSFSRILTQYALMGNKAALPLSVFLYAVWLMPGKSVETIALNGENLGITPLAVSITSFFIIYGILCALLMIILTLPFPKKIGNPGADDNASGVIGALEIAKRVNNMDLDADIKIILFDNEERGLIGSTHYVNKNLKKMKNKEVVVINLDCIGRGSDVFILGSNIKHSKSCKLIKNELSEKKINIECSDIDFSDHKPFLNKGIDAVSIGRYNVKRYLWVKKFPVIDWIHGCEDTPESIDISKIEEIVDVVSGAICREYS